MPRVGHPTAAAAITAAAAARTASDLAVPISTTKLALDTAVSSSGFVCSSVAIHAASYVIGFCRICRRRQTDGCGSSRARWKGTRAQVVVACGGVGLGCPTCVRFRRGSDLLLGLLWAKQSAPWSRSIFGQEAQDGPGSFFPRQASLWSPTESSLHTKDGPRDGAS